MSEIDLPETDLELPLWAQITLGAWLFGTTLYFLRQLLLAYSGGLAGG